MWKNICSNNFPKKKNADKNFEKIIMHSYMEIKSKLLFNMSLFAFITHLNLSVTLLQET